MADTRLWDGGYVVSALIPPNSTQPYGSYSLQKYDAQGMAVGPQSIQYDPYGQLPVVAPLIGGAYVASLVGSPTGGLQLLDAGVYSPGGALITQAGRGGEHVALAAMSDGSGFTITVEPQQGGAPTEYPYYVDAYDASGTPVAGPGIQRDGNDSGPSTLIGSAGFSDTLTAGHEADVLTGDTGSDTFSFKVLPWNPGHVSDFMLGTDKLDLSALLKASGYTGSDPVRDGYVSFASEGAGDTRVYFSPHDGTNGGFPYLITTLDHVSSSGLTWAQLASPSGSGTVGVLLSGADRLAVATNLIGGSGNDTLIADHGPDTLTGGPGADVFTFRVHPGSAGHVTDFAIGEDRLDLSALLPFQGYAGSRSADPVQQGYVTFKSDGAGGTQVWIDSDGSGPDSPGLITTLDNIAPAGLTWAAVAGGDGSPPATLHQAGMALTGDDRDPFILVGGAGNDTLTADHQPDTLTGGIGADAFSFPVLPSSAGHVTDFAVGLDQLDLSRLFKTYGYAGSDPIADGYVSLASDGAGGTRVSFDSDGHGAAAPSLVTTLDNVSPAGLTWAEIGGSASSGGSGGGSGAAGQSLSGNDQSASNLTGGAGNDTLTAEHRADVLTGAGGADVFHFEVLPWSPGHVTDFTVGTDRLDLSALFQASGYTGSDPVADGYVSLLADGAGGTRVYFSPHDGSNGGYPYLITALDNVSFSNVTWAQLAGGGSSAQHGVTLSGNDQSASTLAGGSGADTLTAEHRADTLTGAGGADHFVIGVLPWSPGHVTDFTPGTDVLDLRPVFQAAAYSGSNPTADGTLAFLSDGQGDTWVYFSPQDGSNGGYPYLLTTLDHIAPGQIGAADWLFH
jgi:Ca2+-binding RTX toxin-like protein